MGDPFGLQKLELFDCQNYGNFNVVNLIDDKKNNIEIEVYDYNCDYILSLFNYSLKEVKFMYFPKREMLFGVSVADVELISVEKEIQDWINAGCFMLVFAGVISALSVFNLRKEYIYWKVIRKNNGAY